MLVRVRFLLRDPPFQRRLRRLVPPEGTLVVGKPLRETIAQAIGEEDADIFLTRELALNGELAELLGQAGRVSPPGWVVVFTGSENPEHRTRLLAAGARMVLGESDSDVVIAQALAELVQLKRDEMLLAHRARSAQRHGTLADLISESPRMASFLEQVKKVVPVDSTVLIQGETGVGKERLARVIHAEGPRGVGPFVAVNCAALPESLLEAELFGHERGAFTGAERDRRGKFELAHGGTIFLDEIGEMPMHLQAKLLRVLQEREVERIGSEISVAVDVRVIAASNLDLPTAVRNHRFRADLFYRLSVVQLTIPPLRERREDVPRLLDDYVAHFARVFRRAAPGMSLAAREALAAYSWPGNVRELINVVERAVLLCGEPEIGVADLPDEILAEAAQLMPQLAAESGAGDRWLDVDPEALLRLPLATARSLLLESFERWYVTRGLDATGGRVGEAAQAMGVDPRTLYEKMKRLGLDKRSFRRTPSRDDRA